MCKFILTLAGDCRAEALAARNASEHGEVARQAGPASMQSAIYTYGFAILLTILAIDNDAVRPGDSMPMRLINPGSPLAASS